MSQVGMDCGPTRLPLQDPTPEQIAVLEANLETTGVYDWINGKTVQVFSDPSADALQTRRHLRC